jgi:SAM-dependent methyltransferase
METINTCLVCGSQEINHFIDCKDFTVSQKTFSIQECSKCKFKFSSPRPSSIEIGSYYKSEDYISHSDTKKGLIYRLYHFIRTYTLIKKLQLIMRFSVKKGKLFDYGCGTGAFLSFCKKNGWETFGYEPDDDARKIAIANGADVSNQLNSFENELSCDVFTMWHVLEHVHDLGGLFSFINKHLKANGLFVVAVPNPTSFDAKYYKENWAAYDVPRHLYHFSPENVKDLVEKNGLKLIKIMPMIFDSFYVSMLSEKYKSGKINYFKAFLTGLKSNYKAINNPTEYSSQIYLFKKA